jgi:cytochrome P450
MVALQVITFAAVLEVLLVAKGALSSYLPDMTRKISLASMMILVFSVNYMFWLIYRLIIYPAFVDPLRSFPGPPSMNALKLLWFRLTTTVIPAERYVSVAKRFPDDSVVALRGLGKTQLLLTKPDSIAEVLTHHPYDFIKPPVVREFLGLILGENGLVLAEGERHKFIRKNTRPAFSSRSLQDLYPMMWTKALTLTSLLRDEVQQQSTAAGTVDICPWATRVSLDVIGVAGLGREFNMLKNPEDQLFRAYEYLSEPSLEKIVYFFLCSRFSYQLVQRLPFWRLNVTFREQIESIRRIAQDLVREKREAIIGKGDDNFDILSLLIQSDNFSDAELVDQLLTYLVAG